MKNPAPKKSTKKVRELEPFDKRSIPFDKSSIPFTKFKSELSAKDLRKLLGPEFVVGSVPIETLSPVKTVGLGRTDVLLAKAEVVSTPQCPTPSSTGNLVWS